MRYLLAALLVLIATSSFAITVTPTGTQSTVSYTEPTTNADGTPLADLHHCNVYAAPTSGPEIKSADIPASSATGGANKSTTITVGKGSLYTITASCTDLVGNESARTPGVTLDALPPAPPK
jgi:hypothetical protein